MGFSADQLRTAEITAKCTGSLSILGSVSLITEIMRRGKQKRTTLFQILLGMSLFDIGASIWYVVGSWAIPRDTEGNMFQPSGTEATCHMQGFLFQVFASAIPMYNLSLSYYYRLTVNFGWREDKARNIWWMFHVLPITFGTTTATYGLVFDQFNPNELWCWFSGTEQSDVLKFLFYYGPLWVVFFIIVLIFMSMYKHVRKQEEANKRFSFQQNLAKDPTNNFRLSIEDRNEATRLSRPVFIQGLLFAAVFCLTFIFPTIVRAQQLHKDNIKFPLLFFMTLFLPLQGFMNYLVFKRLQILHIFCGGSRKTNAQNPAKQQTTAVPDSSLLSASLRYNSTPLTSNIANHPPSGTNVIDGGVHVRVGEDEEEGQQGPSSSSSDGSRRSYRIDQSGAISDCNPIEDEGSQTN